MSNEDNIKRQRDRFLSFSFATSDLLLEVDGSGKISFAVGAIKGLTGSKDANSLIGCDWLELFSRSDRMVLKLMVNKSVPGLRCGPALVSFDKAKLSQNIIVSAIKMPNNDNTYISVASSNAIMEQLGQSVKNHHQNKPLDKETFIDLAQETLRMASELGEEVDMTLIDLPSSDKARRRFGEENWDKLSADVNKILCEESIDGGSAAQLSDGKFSFLHGNDIDIDELTTKINEATKEQDPFNEGLEVKTKCVSADMKDMDERDATRALFYTLNEFESKGTEMTIKNLDSSFKTYVTANTQRILQFKKILENLSFSMHFQPIVNLESYECSHYEMLCRFKEGNTFEWVMFCEDIGMAADFDIAVCRRSMSYIDKKRAKTNETFSINISGQSIGNEKFFANLMEEVALYKNIKNRIIFEITESSQIKDLEQVGEFVKKIQAAGFKVALDDFGAGSTSFQYLSDLHVDFVKIDGKYIKNIIDNNRDLIMVKNLTQMCKDLNIKVVGEFVESKEIALKLYDLHVDYGQGYYLGRPEQSPNYIKLE